MRSRLSYPLCVFVLALAMTCGGIVEADPVETNRAQTSNFDAALANGDFDAILRIIKLQEDAENEASLIQSSPEFIAEPDRRPRTPVSSADMIERVSQTYPELDYDAFNQGLAGTLVRHVHGLRTIRRRLMPSGKTDTFTLHVGSAGTFNIAISARHQNARYSMSLHDEHGEVVCASERPQFKQTCTWNSFGAEAYTLSISSAGPLRSTLEIVVT